MKHIFTTFFLLIFAHAFFAQNTYVLDSTTLTSRVVNDSLDIPWEIIWGPDDHIWCTERFGRVSRINPTTGEQDILLDISADVYQRSEAGMLGMVLHPDFANNPHVFIAYTYGATRNVRERLVRFNYTGTSLVAADTLVEEIAGYFTHNGCRLIILPDNTILMTTGDASEWLVPQDTTSLSGKVLRMNLDGSIPVDNPNPASLIWSIGHRNAQGLWLAPNGHIYSSEHGPETDDELNIIKADKNYGWPHVHGYCDRVPEIRFCDTVDVEFPLKVWTPTLAVSDIIWYDHPAIPEFNSTILMTALKDQSLSILDFNADGDSVIRERTYFKGEFGRLRDVCISPSGKIYLASNGASRTNTNPFTNSIIELSNDAYFPTSIEVDESADALVSISPNPLASEQALTISFKGSHHGKFELYDLSGRLVMEKKIEGTENVDLHTRSGIYFYRLSGDDGRYIAGKLVIE